jgi:hypothetical protein
MKLPPSSLDDARVLEFAWSDIPFGHIHDTNGNLVAVIHGLAICQYDGSSVIYRFSCDENWEVESDVDYGSVEEAKALLPDQYKLAPIHWQSLH